MAALMSFDVMGCPAWRINTHLLGNIDHDTAPDHGRNATDIELCKAGDNGKIFALITVVELAGFTHVSQAIELWSRAKPHLQYVIV